MADTPASEFVYRLSSRRHDAVRYNAVVANLKVLKAMLSDKVSRENGLAALIRLVEILDLPADECGLSHFQMPAQAQSPVSSPPSGLTAGGR